MKTITVSGLDGSGKSTQIKLLKEILESQGFKVFYFHAIEFSLANKINCFKNKHCLICKITKKCEFKPQKEKASVTKANFIQIFMRKIFLQLDLWRFDKLIKKLEKASFDYILSDRYFYDTLVNIEYLSKKNISYNYSIIKPNLSIYLKTNPEIIMNRDRTPDQGLQYLIDKKNIYDKYASLFKMKIVDGNKGQEDVKKIIMNHVAHII